MFISLHSLQGSHKNTNYENGALLIYKRKTKNPENVKMDKDFCKRLQPLMNKCSIREEESKYGKLALNK